MDTYNYSISNPSNFSAEGHVASVGQSIDNHFSTFSTANSTSSDSDIRDKQFYESAKQLTGLYLFPIICTLGIVGNVLIFMVFVTTKPRTSTTVFLTTLALSDTIKLLCDFLYFIVVYLESIGDTKSSQLVFATLYPYAHYILNFSLCNTAWLTVAVAVERYIFMKWPERANIICNSTRSTITCIIIWICSMIVAVPFVLRYKHYERADGMKDITVSALWQVDQFTNTYVWVQNIVRSIIPLIVLVILNTWIIRALARLSKHHMQGPPCQIRATSMLVAVIIAFLVCITPDAVLSAVFGFGYTDAPWMIKGIREFSDLLLSVNSAINFFLYFAFNQIFRKKLAQLFCGKHSRCFKSKRDWFKINNNQEGIT